MQLVLSKLFAKQTLNALNFT